MILNRANARERIKLWEYVINFWDRLPIMSRVNYYLYATFHYLSKTLIAAHFPLALPLASPLGLRFRGKGYFG